MRTTVSAILVSACLTFSTPGYALSLQDTLTAWADASENDRLKVARTLAIIASQGLPYLDEQFFEDCIQFASTHTTLQTKKIGEIGSLCVAMVPG